MPLSAPMETDALLSAIADLCDDQSTDGARALYDQLFRYICRRTRIISRSRYADLLDEADQEDVVSDTLVQLISGALQRFRGETIAELIAFARTVTDRRLWRLARRRIAEREALRGEGEETVRSWIAPSLRPDQSLIVIPPSPLNENDTRYLMDVVCSGSQANYARHHSVSRAAVTQRLQRIKRRIRTLSPDDQDRAEVWLQQIIARRQHRRAIL